jgi:hypothetical protein
MKHKVARRKVGAKPFVIAHEAPPGLACIYYRALQSMFHAQQECCYYSISNESGQIAKCWFCVGFNNAVMYPIWKSSLMSLPPITMTSGWLRLTSASP